MKVLEVVFCLFCFLVTDEKGKSLLTELAVKFETVLIVS